MGQGLRQLSICWTLPTSVSSAVLSTSNCLVAAILEKAVSDNDSPELEAVRHDMPAKVALE